MADEQARLADYTTTEATGPASLDDTHVADRESVEALQDLLDRQLTCLEHVVARLNETQGDTGAELDAEAPDHTNWGYW